MHCRLFIPAELVLGQAVEIDDEQTKYLRQVMRLQAGDQITVFNGLGGEYIARLTELGKDGGECSLIHYIEADRELPCKVHIIQAANRSEKIETVLQKATEMGAASFQIINSERATLSLPENKREKRLKRWQKIIIEAAEQSERTILPSVMWREKLSAVEKFGQGFVLHPRDAKLWKDVRGEIHQMQEITLAIGPEGGWSDKELAFFGEQGYGSLKFGERIMRTETAAPALLAAIEAVL